MTSLHWSTAPTGRASRQRMGRTWQLRRPWRPGPASLLTPSALGRAWGPWLCTCAPHPAGATRRQEGGPVASFPPGVTERFNSLGLHPRVQGLRVRRQPQCWGLWARAGAPPPFPSPKAAAQPPLSAGDICLRNGPGNSPVLAAPCRAEPTGKSSPCSGEPEPPPPAPLLAATPGLGPLLWPQHRGPAHHSPMARSHEG